MYKKSSSGHKMVIIFKSMQKIMWTPTESLEKKSPLPLMIEGGHICCLIQVLIFV